LKGKIKKIVRERGFGFITAEGGEEVFFHRSALERGNFEALQEGDSVELNMESGPKGARATSVRLTRM